VSAAVWLLDIDGVLNGFGRCGWSGPPRTSRVLVDGLAYRIRWAPQLIDRIGALHDSGLVEIRWATTWVEHGTDQIERLTGLPAFPHAYRHIQGVRHRDAKLNAALDVAGFGHRLIWTDDDAIPAAGPDRETLDAAGALLVVPDERRALRPEDLDAIEAYVREVS
jgi:hypothetical protein